MREPKPTVTFRLRFASLFAGHMILRYVLIGLFLFFLIGSFECGVQFGREVKARKIQAHERESRDLRKFSTHRFVRVSRERISFYLSPNWTSHSNEPIKTKQKYVDDKKRGKTQSYSRFGFPLIG